MMVDLAADFSRSDKEVEWAPLAVTDSVQLDVHTAFGTADQAATPPIFTVMQVAVRWAMN